MSRTGGIRVHASICAAPVGIEPVPGLIGLDPKGLPSGKHRLLRAALIIAMHEGRRGAPVRLTPKGILRWIRPESAGSEGGRERSFARRAIENLLKWNPRVIAVERNGVKKPLYPLFRYIVPCRDGVEVRLHPSVVASIRHRGVTLDPDLIRAAMARGPLAVDVVLFSTWRRRRLPCHGCSIGWRNFHRQLRPGTDRKGFARNVRALARELGIESWFGVRAGRFCIFGTVPVSGPGTAAPEKRAARNVDQLELVFPDDDVELDVPVPKGHDQIDLDASVVVGESEVPAIRLRVMDDGGSDLPARIRCMSVGGTTTLRRLSASFSVRPHQKFRVLVERRDRAPLPPLRICSSVFDPIRIPLPPPPQKSVMIRLVAAPKDVPKLCTITRRIGTVEITERTSPNSARNGSNRNPDSSRPPKRIPTLDELLAAIRNHVPEKPDMGVYQKIMPACRNSESSKHVPKVPDMSGDIPTVPACHSKGSGLRVRFLALVRQVEGDGFVVQDRRGRELARARPIRHLGPLSELVAEIAVDDRKEPDDLVVVAHGNARSARVRVEVHGSRGLRTMLMEPVDCRCRLRLWAALAGYPLSETTPSGIGAGSRSP